MKITRRLSLFLAAVMAVTAFSGVNVGAADLEKAGDETVYNFAAADVAGAVNLNDGSVPMYSADKGYGFISETSTMPPRSLGADKIEWTEDGFKMTEDGSGSYLSNKNTNNYNYGGLAFRIDVPASGAYRITAELSNGATSSNTYVAPSGMQASRITGSSVWDSAGLVPIKHYAMWTSSTTWTYDYVCGEPYIELEIEPTAIATASANKTVGVKSITVEKLELNTVSEGDKPTVFVLGDSTEKTYTFEEAGMSGWGQIVGKMFDESKVNVINYSMGGRSMKACYTENRFNDILMTAKPGDYVMIHSAHNDESTGDSAGPEARFGRGSTTADYKRWLNDIYIPAILSRGATPVLVTPMPRTSDGKYTAGFNPDSPGLMKEAAAANDAVLLVDLYTNAKAYIDEMGTSQIKSIYMAIEAGESPGKTNSGSYANGHPDNKIDGTHYKEAAAKVWSKIIAEQIYKNKDTSADMSRLASYLKSDVVSAAASGSWGEVFPEWTNDVTYAKSGDFTAEGDPVYYRNQIEKLLELGVMFKDENNNFKPLEGMKTNDFISALCAVWKLDLTNPEVEAVFAPYYESGTLIREKMAAIILDAYELRFGKNSDGSYKKPPYMTDYNGSTVSPDDPTYDPNLTGAEAQYYPLVGWGNLTDKKEISLEYAMDVYDVYNLGLMRSESGIARGSMKNGTLFEPKKEVTRAKAAKELWFLWVLGQNNVRTENQVLVVTNDGVNYSAPVYNEIAYTAPAYEFSSVDIANDGVLSVTLTGTGNGSLKISVYGADGSVKAEKSVAVAGSGAVSGLDVTLSKGEYVVMQVVSADGLALSSERTAVCTELIVPQRSYTVKNEAGIKNGTIGIKNLTEEGADANGLNVSMSADMAADDTEGTVTWRAAADVAKDQVLLDSADNGVCHMTATYDMTYAGTSFKVGDESFAGYVAHASVNGYLASTGRDRSGLLFTAYSDGVLTAYAQNVGSNKKFVIIENSETSEAAALVSSLDLGLSGNCKITATVTAGNTYYIGVLGSKGRFAGIDFTAGAPVVSTLAKAGETVQITAAPNSGYKVSAVSAADSEGNLLELKFNSDKTISTFTMPESDVIVSASFVSSEGGGEEPVEPIEPEIGLMGDVDGNGILTANDAASLLSHILTGAKAEGWNLGAEADVDESGDLTASDAAQILSKVLNSAYKFKKL